MLFVQTAGSPAVGPRVGLVAAAYVFLIDGNRQGDAHRPGLDRPSARSRTVKSAPITGLRLFWV